jgi:hypothetical protein
MEKHNKSITGLPSKSGGVSNPGNIWCSPTFVDTHEDSDSGFEVQTIEKSCVHTEYQHQKEFRFNRPKSPF